MIILFLIFIIQFSVSCAALSVSDETEKQIVIDVSIKGWGAIAGFPLKGAYWISSNSSFIQYCDSNIGLFSTAPPLVIALPTLR